MHWTLETKAPDTGGASGQLSACAAEEQHPPNAAQFLSPDAPVLAL
jgi:hypothetical protein